MNNSKDKLPVNVMTWRWHISHDFGFRRWNLISLKVRRPFPP